MGVSDWSCRGWSRSEKGEQEGDQWTKCKVREKEKREYEGVTFTYQSFDSSYVHIDTDLAPVATANFFPSEDQRTC